ncbi:MAG: NAD(P)/FAD-dependent oxidoreductase [Parvibaculum sp.]|uniref:phytoene desaturase family protein n=1 Tax=Parvibaculum sp. TaxID=2024848 RepID=UPI00283BC58C|nr:NAD(P)/FAD-dependent oxidoreductase [Parvibaculum sp.]MDR3500352.1 NAD(P)/FAD-dependent oxidoreductase [Parvibaculum sp.]
MQRHDVIVIGGGLNGLTAAACLARAGADVLLLERNAGFGVAAGYDVAPGFRMPRYSLGTSTLPARLVADLELTRHGLRLLRVDGGVSLLAGGAYQASYRDGIVHRRELARVSPKDADAWTRYRRDMLAAAARLRPLLSRRMSDPSKRSIANIRRLLGAADAFASIGATELHELTRLWTLSAADFLSDYFVSEEVKSHLAAAVLSGATFGPFAPGSARLLLQPFMEETGAASAGAPAAVLALGGPEAVAAAFVAAIVAHGGTVRTEAEVTDIILRRDEARGVSLANGEEIYARAILSDLDLKRTFLTLFPWKELPSGLVKRVGRFRLRGVTAKINIALDAAPLFPDVPEGCPALLGVTRLAGSLDEMDRALDDWRDRMPPRAPLIEALVPSLVDRSLAPEGKHVMSVCVHGVPEILHDGPWTGARRDELAELAVKRIAERSPGFRDRILALDTLVPPDIEAEVGLTSGDFAQGEETLDQMFFNRPFASLSGHETPIRNFYLCSASGHPGSLAPGGAGADAAKLVAEALGKRGIYVPA